MTEESVQPFTELQDFGELNPTLRRPSDIGASGVQPLVPDQDESHIDTMEVIREQIDQTYGDVLDSFTDSGEELLIDRVTFRADDVPIVEYTVVDEQ